LIDRVYSVDCPKDEKVMFCYYQSWAVYRPTFGAYNVSNIDPTLCTHYVYAFVGLSIEGLTMTLDPVNDLPESGGMQQFYYFRMMKEDNPCIKVLLSVGGWNEGSEKYSVMAETEDSMDKFTDHLLRYLVYYGFDGVDMDWEYPTQRGGIPIDRTNFVTLLGKIKARLEPRGKLLSVAVGAAVALTDSAYDVKSISDIVDYVLLMSYDYQQENVTTYMAPMNNVAGDPNSGSVVASVNKWLALGCPLSKLVLGIQTTGRSYTLKSPNSDPKLNIPGMAASGPGKRGPFTDIDGFFSYYEICDMLFEETDWHVVSNDAVYASSYATKGDQWIAYEDEKTVLVKSQYAASQNLAGLLVWTLDTDDFRGFCGEYPNVLLRAMRTGLGKK